LILIIQFIALSNHKYKIGIRKREINRRNKESNLDHLAQTLIDFTNLGLIQRMDQIQGNTYMKL